MRRLIVGSGNQHKVAELRHMLDAAGLELEVLSLRDLSEPPPVVEETATTFAGNARLKADGFASWLARIGEAPDSWVLADDSGISIDALDGEPGGV